MEHYAGTTNLDLAILNSLKEAAAAVEAKWWPGAVGGCWEWGGSEKKTWHHSGLDREDELKGRERKN